MNFESLSAVFEQLQFEGELKLRQAIIVMGKKYINSDVDLPVMIIPLDSSPEP
jgi:hypothetical protein